MTTKNSLPTILGHKHFTGNDSRPWTKFLMSDGKTKLEQGHMQGPFLVTQELYKGKKQINIWSVAK